MVSAAALILFDQESPRPLACLNFCVVFITEILDFSSSFDESPPSALRFISFRAKNLESLQCLVTRTFYKHLFVLPDFM
ncbi:hypothetical protein HMPREF1576_01368 [Gardnerella pickettii JCP7719]|uniref:Uncharacterized protein n=1 Tax=Gardnerella pickettii JCP7719 TaxID=1261061 RepID=S4GVJ5_9BIFI|nr:hypothetical protein HMPREF1576_01368 [Gardnerella pickettii JCP7719]